MTFQEFATIGIRNIYIFLRLSVKLKPTVLNMQQQQITLGIGETPIDILAIL